MTKKWDSNSHDEREALLGFLHNQREALCRSVYGLTDEQAALAPSASALSLGGLLRHLTAIEGNWTGILQVTGTPNGVAEHLASFQPGGSTVEELIADYRRAAEATDAAFLAIPDLEQLAPVPQGVPWFPKDVESWTARYILVHLIEETARHAGHADIIRETLDGAQSIELKAAAEGWPESDFVKPWRKPAQD
ncbi:DinB family protein [Actinospica durhamensis]|uniref:DinB family protein n=1 Tax=Actinospica durhamensis TaxID=1508375 RepID=A0A941ISL6_9ACTN|nr:DinB family protein [Actinospica durhamensis]MBR7838649.1 DinB family protein [Actinospica durhamensis]